MNYYNENDPFAAAWLRELIKADLISQGEVDERSIEDVVPTDLRGYRQCHFFAGIGGWSYALRLAGWPDDRPVWTGSCPCQPFSAIAQGRRGSSDERHLWPAFYRLISECRPSVVFGEQVSSKDGRHWLDGVREDLEAIGYAVGAADLCAASVGAPHIRQRLYWMGDSSSEGLERYSRNVRNGDESGWDNPYPIGSVGEAGWASPWDRFDSEWDATGARRRVEPGTFPLAHGIPARVGRLRGYGNAIVPQVAQAFIESYLEAKQ